MTRDDVETKPIHDDACPAFPSGVRTKFDKIRGMWVLLAPERAVKLDAIGTAVLAEVDGKQTFGAITAALATKYSAPRDQIARDAGAFLVSLAERRMLDIHQ